MALPKLALTIGDPAGIGPEVTSKALLDKSIYEICRPVVIGDVRLITNHKKLSEEFECQFIDIPCGDIAKIVPGRFSRITGKCSYDYILKSVELINEGVCDGVVTAPVSKEAMSLAGVKYPGQTELFADLSGTKKYGMLMAAEQLRVVMVTRHMSLTEVSKNLSIDIIKDTVVLTQAFISKNFGIVNPKIIVCSLNPHGGEGGMFGKEERMFIVPAVKMLQETGFNISGPFGADSAWLKMIEKRLDFMVAMYHDQAMVGLKCLNPEKIVNITMGLPFVRTSPGHGTGFDIAGKNIADPTSMKEAIKLAAKLSLQV
jgi:4-hydroxythreonine-4-phosphate dehydrogenase